MATTTELPSSNELLVRVVIPARNERQTIERALDALRRQVDFSGRPLAPGSFDVTVLANNCDDDTAALARAYADRFPAFPLRVLEQIVPADRATLGPARLRLIDEACVRFAATGVDGIVASTAAYTVVAPDWIAATLAEFERGADAVGGRVVFTARDLARMTPEARRMHLQDAGYQLLLAELGARIDPNPSDPSPCHHQNCGASFAVRSDVYRRASHRADVTNLDASLCIALQQIDANIRHSPHVRVTASAQRLLDGPDEWADAFSDRRTMLVEPVSRSVKRLQLHRELRGRWRFRHSHEELTRGTHMDAFTYFGAYLAGVQPEIERYLDEATGNEPVPLATAIGDLRAELTVYH